MSFFHYISVSQLILLIAENISARRDPHDKLGRIKALNISTDIENSRPLKSKTTSNHGSSFNKASSSPLDQESPSSSSTMYPSDGDADTDSETHSISNLSSPPSPTEDHMNRKALARDKEVVLRLSGEEAHVCWDFKLPSLKAPNSALGQADNQDFSNKTLTRYL